MAASSILTTIDAVINLLVSIVLPDCKSMEEWSWRFEKFCYR